MRVVTILCHGTMNSTKRSTSEGSELVISKIAFLLAGRDGADWILNEGAGTKELRRQGIDSGTAMGIAAGEGVQGNVDKSVDFVKRQLKGSSGGIGSSRGIAITVNLAGHSRGSITCYKIASALLNDADPAVRSVPVNIFAIDPVPGNNGSLNKENFTNLALGSNVKKSFLMLAESEHRLNFRPYVDALYSIGKKEHKFDTIPGTHGGINMLTGNESEAATIVLSRALNFLKKSGSLFGSEVDNFIMNDAAAARMYSKMMLRIKKYKAHASVNPLKGGLGNLLASSLNVDKHRIANVAGDKKTWGYDSASATDQGAQTRSRNDHHGLSMASATERMGVSDGVHAQRTNRFFANQHHEKAFEKLYASIFNEVKNLERSGAKEHVASLRKIISSGASGYANMSAAEMRYFDAFCSARGVI
jgi:hypothetical protein